MSTYIAKKILHTILLAVLLILLNAGCPNISNAMTGSGTADDPFIITTVSDLNAVSNNLTASYELANDIDLNNTTWTPISGFKGNFDGNGYGIKNLTSTTKGLFDSVTGTSSIHATIENLTLTVKSINTSSSNVGGLVGSGSYLDISEVAVLNADSGTGINSSGDRIGGMIGSAGSANTITDSYAILPVSGSTYVGGLVGYKSTNPIITRCYFAGTVTGGSSVYGLVSNATFTSSYYDGVVAGIDPVDKEQMKLTSGMTHQEIYIDWDFTNTWAIDEGSSYPYLINLQKPVNVTGIDTSDVPSGAGTSADPYIITTVPQLDKIRYDIYAFYKLGCDVDLDNTTWTPVPDFHGNFDGNGYGIKNLTSTTKGLFESVTGTSSAHVIIENLTLTVESINTSSSNIGGLVGSGSYLDISEVAVLNSDSGTGINSSSSHIGGIIGSAGSATTITDSYAILPVSGSTYVGGLVGYNASSTSRPIITRCYFAGTVTGGSSVYGLAGSATFISSYYDSTVAGIFTGTGAKTTEEMKQQATFIGWDFVHIWYMDEGVTYPYIWTRTPETENSEFKKTLGRQPFNAFGNDPVNTVTGNFTYDHTDLNIPAKIPLELTRYYNSRDEYTGPLGKGWQHNYNTYLTVNQDNSIAVKYPDGHMFLFAYENDSYNRPTGCFENLSQDTDGTYILTFKNQTKYVYDSQGRLTNITDNNDNSISMQYIGSLLTTVTEPAGRSLNFEYDANNRLIRITDPAGAQSFSAMIRMVILLRCRILMEAALPLPMGNMA